MAEPVPEGEAPADGWATGAMEKSSNKKSQINLWAFPWGIPQKWVGLQFSKAWLVDDPIRDSFLARCLAHIGDDHNHREARTKTGNPME